MDSEIFAEDLRNIDGLIEGLNGSLSIKYFKDENYWRGSIKFDGAEYFFQINYIYVYPLFPPPLFCFKDETYSEIWIDKLWSAHSYNDGHLCLFTNDRGESAWKENYRIDEVIRKFLTLLRLTKENKISSKHTSEIFKVDDYAFAGDVYISKDLFQIIQTSNESMLCYYAIAKEQPTINYDRILDLPMISIFSENSPESTLFLTRDRVECRFFSEAEYTQLQNGLVEDSILRTQNFFKFCEQEKVDFSQSNAFLFGNKGDEKATAFFIRLKPGNIKPEWYIVNKKYSFLEAIFIRESNYLSEEFKILENKSVVIIGLGTLGSKIAIELARNGVKNLILFDNDYYKPENVARGIGPYFFVGKPKSDVVEQMIREISPAISVIGFHNSPLNPIIKEKFIDILKKVDLVICAIDSELDEIEIQKICVENEVPAIYTIALDHGHYGRIYRVIPSISPCTECIKRQIETDPAKFPALDTTETDEPQIANNFNPYEHPGVPGINVFISEIALKTVQLSLQTLARDSKLQEYFPAPPSDHLLISNKKGWIFDAPYQVRYLEFQKLEDCPICGKLDEKADKKIKTNEEIQSLLDKYVN